jgi:hypothetical protein
MNIPIRFPNDADVIAEEAARFRDLSSDAKVRALEDSWRVYQFLMANSDRKSELQRLAEEEEELTLRAIHEFAARHG